MKKLDFYYFSGTGNTYLVVKEMQKFFETHGFEVQLYCIEKSEATKIDPQNMLGLAFPVAMQSTYKFVWEFLEAIPPIAEPKDAFLVDTKAIFSGGVKGPVYRLLKKKGYRPIAAKEIKMPHNMNLKKPPSKVEKKQIKGLNKARKFAHDITFGISRWPHLPLPNPLKKISQNEKILELMRNKNELDIDTTKCIKCGICYKLCPIDNIVMDHYPEFKDNCQMCMRCLSFCPTQAIKPDGKDFFPYTAVNSAELL
jgi:ferredoxin/flavodoxin